MSAAATTTGPRWQEEFFQAKDGVRLFHASLVPPSASAVAIVVHGYADHALRYRPVMEALAARGIAAHAFDYRGHGQAGGRRGFCERFQDFLDDLAIFVTRVRARSGRLPLFLVAHSHGALVTTTWLVSKDAPADVAGLVVTGAYFRLQIEPSRLQLLQAKVVGRFVPWLPIRNPITVQQLTRDEALQRAFEADPLRHHVVTPKWFTESQRAQEELPAKWASLTLPLLAIHGDADSIARPDMAQAFVDAVGSRDKTFVLLPGGMHEPYNDLDREKVLAEVGSWIEARIAGRAAA